MPQAMGGYRDGRQKPQEQRKKEEKDREESCGSGNSNYRSSN